MTVDLYDPRVMAAAFAEMDPPRRFLQSTFFPTRVEYLAENVDLDSEEGVRVLAPFSNPEGPGKVMDRAGFTTTSVTPPLLAPKRVITARDIATRAPGENIYSGIDPGARAGRLLAGDLRFLDDAITRREEWMCSKVLFDSALTISGDDVGAYAITFARSSALNIGTLGAGVVWSHANGVPLDNMEDWAELVTKLSGATANIMIAGSLAWQAMRKNAQVLASLNVLRMEMGRVAPVVPGVNGARYVGEFAGTGLPIYTYNEWYVDPVTGVTTPMVPPKSILIGSTEFRSEMRYGGVDTMTGDTSDALPTKVAGARVPRSWISMDPPMRWIQLKSRPLPVPVQNRYLTAQVLT